MRGVQIGDHIEGPDGRYYTVTAKGRGKVTAKPNMRPFDPVTFKRSELLVLDYSRGHWYVKEVSPSRPWDPRK